MIQKSLNDNEGARAHLETAISVLEPLVAKSPDKPGYQRELGRAYYNLAMTSTWPKGQTETLQKADRAISAAMQQDPQNVHVYTDRAWIRQWLGKETEAFQDMFRAVELGSSDGVLRAHISWELLFGGRFGGEKPDRKIALEHATKAVDCTTIRFCKSSVSKVPS